MSRPLVTAIVTTYNSAATIARTLDSLFAQEGLGVSFALEVIVVDDRSTDATYDIVGEYPEVRLLVNEVNSGGPNRGRNRGLDQAKGSAICIVDHDDEWLPDRLLRQLPALTTQVPVVSCGYTVVDATGSPNQVRAKSCVGGTIAFRQNDTFLARLRRRPGGQTTYLGTLLYAGSLRGLRFEEVYGAVDYDFILRLFEGRASVEVCAALYRRHVLGTNLSLDEGYRLKDFAHSRATLEAYRERYPTAAAQGLRRLHGSLARYYYLIEKMPEARRHFRLGEVSAKTVLYWLTSWAGSRWVKRRFNVFG